MLPQTCLPVTAGSMQTADDPLPCGVDSTPDDLPLTKTTQNVDMTVKEESGDQDHEDVQDGSPLTSLSEPVKPFEETNQLIPSDPPIASVRGDSRKTTTRGRRRSRWKLKFHHQALPPEYLDHYEASIAQQDASNTRARSSKVLLQSTKATTDPSSNVKSDRDSPDSTNLSKGISQSLLEQLCLPLPSKNNVVHRTQNSQPPDDRLKYCDRSLQSKCLLGTLLLEKDGKRTADDHRKRSSVIMSSAANSSSARANPVCNSQGTKVVKYQDLPYMGEITLDNMKPRRGRKPKKADICHLIYKNYGTIFSGGPKMQEKVPQSSLTHNTKVKSDSDLANNLRCKTIESLKNNTPINHTDVQNRIISSLLEKRLTAASQDSRKNFLGNSDSLLSKNVDNSSNSKRESSLDEPLNLCVKDLNQLKIRLLRKHGNFYEPRLNDSVIKTEFNDLQEIDIEGNEDAFLENTDVLNTAIEPDSIPGLLSLPFPNDTASPSNTPNSTLPGGYVYWPNAGVFVHPMALQSQLLYYQKMGSIPLLPLSPGENASSLPSIGLTQNSNVSTPHPKIASTSKSSKSVASAKPLVPKAFSVMVDSGIKNSVMPSELTFPRMKRLAPSGNLPSMGTPAKRKRSAIFIPPMPSDNNANPTTEVSICKFKFTGGAKPSLQEKKMLSVDSGGNFRYYSGTGDKSMRGYEFFPRESLQQMGNNIESPSEVFLTASALGSGEKLPIPNMPKETGKTSRTETVTNVLPRSQTQQPTEYGEVNTNCYSHQNVNPRLGAERLPPPVTFNAQHLGNQDEEVGSQFRLRRKRKTRKSLAREKLEQTFKEKGFLIQTQQLESAEGATYCKFRQLRKFTRYLFRSWKDYLPGNVREMSVAAGVGGSQDSEPEEQTCSSPPTPRTVPSGDDAFSIDTLQAIEHNSPTNKQSH